MNANSKKLSICVADIFAISFISLRLSMPKKRQIPNSNEHLTEMTKQDDGYHVYVEKFDWSYTLPTDDKILSRAIEICGQYDSPDSLSSQILKRCSIELELVNEKGVYENRIGVVVYANKNDAETLAGNVEMYNDVMSALGESCGSIDSDRVEVVN